MSRLLIGGKPLSDISGKCFFTGTLNEGAPVSMLPEALRVRLDRGEAVPVEELGQALAAIQKAGYRPGGPG